MAFYHMSLEQAQTLGESTCAALLDCIPDIEAMKAWFKAASMKAGNGDVGAMTSLAQSVFANDPIRQAAVLENLGALRQL